MKITLNNNKSKLSGHVKQILKLRDHPRFAIRVKGAFFSPAFRKRQWDGFIRFISETGLVDTGKVPEIIQTMEELYPNEKITIEDEREYFTEPKRIPKVIEGFETRGYQIDSVRSIVENNLPDGTPFPRGIIGAATNAGKTLISAMFHLTYGLPTLFIINSKELLDSAIDEIPKLLPGKVGILASGHKTEWKPFMIVMVKTAKTRIREIEHKFSKYPVVLVDECDLSTSKTYRDVLNYTYNAFVRVGLSGSALADKRQKERNNRLLALFGPVTFKIGNRELMDKGYSSEVKVFILGGNKGRRVEDDYDEEYREGIIDNKVRNRKIIRRASYHVAKERLPLLIITKNHKHVDNLFKLLQKKTWVMGHTLFEAKIDYVHHKREDRTRIVKKFTKGKIDILVGSYILKRGKNFPLMRAIINSGGGDSIANVLQILGRATRKHESKKLTILDDFFDEGKYLARHSRHRIITYKNEKISVHEKYKEKKKGKKGDRQKQYRLFQTD